MKYARGRLYIKQITLGKFKKRSEQSRGIERGMGEKLIKDRLLGPTTEDRDPGGLKIKRCIESDLQSRTVFSKRAYVNSAQVLYGVRASVGTASGPRYLAPTSSEVGGGRGSVGCRVSRGR